MNPRQQQQEEEHMSIKPYAPLFFFNLKVWILTIAAILLMTSGLVWEFARFTVGIALVLTLGLVAWFSIRWFQWYTINIKITNRAIIYTWYTFLLTEKRKEFPITKVTSVYISQNLLERLMNAGDIIIATPSGEERLLDIGNIEEIRDKIIELTNQRTE